jgi:hypothetical protein
MEEAMIERDKMWTEERLSNVIGEDVYIDVANILYDSPEIELRIVDERGVAYMLPEYVSSGAVQRSSPPYVHIYSSENIKNQYELEVLVAIIGRLVVCGGSSGSNCSND